MKTSVGEAVHSAVRWGPSGRVCHQGGESPGDLGSADKKSFIHPTLRLFLHAGHTDGIQRRVPAGSVLRLTPAALQSAETSGTERASRKGRPLSLAKQSRNSGWGRTTPLGADADPAGRVRPHGLRARSHQAAPPRRQTPAASASSMPPAGGGSHDPLLGLVARWSGSENPGT